MPPSHLKLRSSSDMSTPTSQPSRKPSPSTPKQVTQTTQYESRELTVLQAILSEIRGTLCTIRTLISELEASTMRDRCAPIVSALVSLRRAFLEAIALTSPETLLLSGIPHSVTRAFRKAEVIITDICNSRLRPLGAWTALAVKCKSQVNTFVEELNTLEDMAIGDFVERRKRELAEAEAEPAEPAEEALRRESELSHNTEWDEEGEGEEEEEEDWITSSTESVAGSSSVGRAPEDDVPLVDSIPRTRYPGMDWPICVPSASTCAADFDNELRGDCWYHNCSL
ncbi:hypothetical protein DFP72DRAFT_1073397 [Ephemerocybe angulata]|uniref:Uncharacterized protein n=1 Tax=Ephemerocybe angulata TaxID=980116 RepID=A0A8H6HMQ5_9AGAR|nr:hypothetical protein DFP72DRAFT_1073397 [Tulosesus angulatus]